MAGLLTHLAISSGLFILVIILFRKWYYGLAGFVGHLMPDIIKFGFVAVKIESISYYKILREPLFYTLDHYTGFYLAGYFFWIMLIVFFAIVCSMLVFFKFIKKKMARKVVISTLIFSLAAILHLIIDIFVIERNPWV